MPPRRSTIDLNSDLGESFGAYRVGHDAELFPIISSANAACGFHGGDPRVMERTVADVKRHGIAIGAHPGPDPSGSGGGRSLRHPTRSEPTPSTNWARWMRSVGRLDAAPARQGAWRPLPRRSRTRPSPRRSSLPSRPTTRRSSSSRCPAQHCRRPRPAAGGARRIRGSCLQRRRQPGLPLRARGVDHQCRGGGRADAAGRRGGEVDRGRWGGDRPGNRHHLRPLRYAGCGRHCPRHP